MKVPIIWLKDYIDIKKSTKEIAESFTALGLLLDKPVETVAGEEVLDLEHRMDRADWLSILGCARDLAAMEKLPLNHPDTNNESFPQIESSEKVEINVEEEGFVNRFNTRIIKNIRNGPSPEWMQKRLEAYGIPARNLIVDITNYVMIEQGQPMHAHDISKMENKEITFRPAKEGEKIVTLLGETIDLTPESWVITNGSNPKLIAGIVGGKDIAVDESTTDIVLDSGSYDQTKVRKISRLLKIHNETVLRYDKFLHPKANELAISRATELYIQLGGPQVEVFENEDYYPKPWDKNKKTVRLARIKMVGGVDYDIGRVKETLEALEYKTLSATESDLEMEIPYFRTDVEVEDDLVADVLRINNYATIKPEPIQAAPPKEITPEIYKFENILRDLLVRLSLHEHITDPLVEKDDRAGQVILQNALTSEKSAMRTSITETLAPVLQTYKKHKFSEIGVFEIGLVYGFEGEDVEDFYNYAETRMLEVLYADFGQNQKASTKKLKKVLATILGNLGIRGVEYMPKGRDMKLFKDSILLGELRMEGFSLYTEALLQAKTDYSRARSQIPNTSVEDISVVMGINEIVGNVYSFIEKYNSAIMLVEVQDIFADEKSLGKDKKAVLFRLHINNSEDVTLLRNNLFEDLHKELGLEIRQ